MLGNDRERGVPHSLACVGKLSDRGPQLVNNSAVFGNFQVYTYIYIYISLSLSWLLLMQAFVQPVCLFGWNRQTMPSQNSPA